MARFAGCDTAVSALYWTLLRHEARRAPPEPAVEPAKQGREPAELIVAGNDDVSWAE